MEDVYYKKTIDFFHAGQTLKFHVSQDLFSSHQVDVGTARLLRSLDSTRPFHKILDLGCGYGPLGLTLKKLYPESRVHLVDRDALAVLYTRQNATLNHIADVCVYGSLGYDEVQERDFDLIISNIPGKAGEKVIAGLLRDACHFLKPDGLVAIVVVAALEATVTPILSVPDIEIVFQETRSGHAIFHYRFSEAYRAIRPPYTNGFAAGLYHRDAVTITTGPLTFPMQTARGLPEFDGLSYHSRLLIEGLLTLRDTPFNRVLVFNPGQGHIPVALWQIVRPEAIVLMDRDLLSLQYARHNLIQNGCPASRITTAHQVDLASQSADQTVDLIAGILREEEGPAAAEWLVQQAAAQLTPGGWLWLVAGSTPITRLEKAIHSGKLWRIEKRKRDKGLSLLALRRK
ncbi:MAG TPA: methyltransferase [Anaerolineae bacterium]|nr:methyltransferase [Anaerolineae bacterium]HQK15732.1 methyltransferase [Anaerolineae bacterium]